MKEIIVIRTSDPDGSIFRSILGALQGKDVQILHAADLDPSALTLGDIEIFPEQRRVTKAGVEVCLNYGEFSILCCMARRPGHVFSREQLYNAAWGEDYELGTNTVDNTIWRLRSKLEPDPKHPTYIKTVFRVGYKIESASVSGAIFCHYKKPKCDEKKGDFTFLDEVLMISPR